MIEIKEIFLRIESGDYIRRVSESLCLHRNTIRNYIDCKKRYEFDPLMDTKKKITEELIQEIKVAVQGVANSTDIAKETKYFPSQRKNREVSKITP